ncbi:MAG: FtsQ-type POTRA domain-containing protein [Gemmatimonadetes bacterium]|nr:FtsQ-type POTRA domain-containing protein [Gemmatimonadota bacterium]
MSGRIPRRLRGPALTVLALLAAGGATLVPRGLRNVDSFRVQRVEVVGTRFLEPYSVVKAAGLGRDSNVFDDPAAWRAGVMTLALVSDVRIRRKLPATVEITVTEVEPVALVAGPELRAVDASGWIVPLDPASTPLDLPILSGVEARGGRLVPAEGAKQALDALLAIRRDAPELAGRVSQIERAPGLLRVVFRDEAAEALLPVEASELQLRQLRLAYADLVSRGELSNVRRIDLRFRDQVVVSFLRPVS